MRQIRHTKDRLVLREQSRGSVFLGVVFSLVGGGFLLITSAATLTCDRPTDTCTLERHGLWSSVRTLSLSEIGSAAVHTFYSSDGDETYSLALETSNGSVYFLSSSSSAWTAQQRAADEINAFLADPEAASLVATRDERWLMYLFTAIFGGVGLVLLLRSTGGVTVTLDRFSGTVTRRTRFLLRRSTETYAFNEVAGVVISGHAGSSGDAYCVLLRRTDGPMIQLNSTYTPGLSEKRLAAERVRAFLNLPPVEEDMQPGLEEVEEVEEVKDVKESLREARARMDEAFREAAHDVVRQGEAAPLARDAGIGRLAANIPSRAVAVFIDFLVLLVVAYALSGLGVEVATFTASWALAAFGYYSLYEGLMGATLGKQLLGMRVVRLDGSPISWKEALVRNAVRFIDAFGFYLVGGILAMKSPARQRLGDRLAGTVVVWRRALPALEEAARLARAPA